MQSLLIRPKALQHEVFVIQPKGYLNADAALQLHHHLNIGVSSEQHSRLLIDMQQVEQLDSAGLMALISAFKLAKKFNKHLSLCSVSYSVRMILELTQLDQVLEIVEPIKVANAA